MESIRKKGCPEEALAFVAGGGEGKKKRGEGTMLPRKRGKKEREEKIVVLSIVKGKKEREKKGLNPGLEGRGKGKRAQLQERREFPALPLSRGKGGRGGRKRLPVLKKGGKARLEKKKCADVLPCEKEGGGRKDLFHWGRGRGATS